MYCQQQDYYQMQQGDYQSYGVPYQGNNLQTFTNEIPVYSPNSPVDHRPSPSFRIEDLIHHNKQVNQYISPMYQQNGHFQQFPGGINLNTQTPAHSCMMSKDYPGLNSTPMTHQFPAYFRLKPNSRMIGGRKCRKPRTVFSELQLMVLEREFSERKYLSTPQRTKLADRLALNPTQVKTWYQNRRMKWKKETNETDTKKLKQMTSPPDDDDTTDVTNTQLPLTSFVMGNPS